MVDRLAAGQAGITSRRELYAAGITRGEVRAQVRARRWRRCGTHAIATFTGPLDQTAQWWVALVEGGPRAMLDGETSLLVAGLQRYRPGAIRVTVPRGARIRHRGTSIDIRQTRRWTSSDVEPTSILRRTRTPVAAVRAFIWAVSQRQGTLLLTMAVQQRLVSVEELATEALRIRFDKRRAALHAVILDLAGGVQSLAEIDVLSGCRRRGMPEPDVQAVRRTEHGTYFLDFRWSALGVVLEVDGIQHLWVEQVIADALRHNEIALTGDVVLRLPVLGLRLAPDAFFNQLAAALRAAGWSPEQAA
jgi:very-short-patch-repair endonuclease